VAEDTRVERAEDRAGAARNTGEAGSSPAEAVKSQGGPQRPSPNSPYDGEVVFSIPVADYGIHYEGGQAEDTSVWGPASLRVAPDGSFLVADTADNKVLQYSPDGSMTNAVKVAEAEAVTDVAVRGGDLYVLDEAAPEPAVHRLTTYGAHLETLALPTELRQKGVSGIRVGRGGELLAESAGDATRLDRGAFDKLSEKRLTTRAPDLSDKSEDQSVGLLTGKGPSVKVKVKNALGGLSVIGEGPNEETFVLVEEVSDTQVIRVDQTVRKYSAAGNLLGVARVPLSERYTYVKNGVALAPDGSVYALVTRPDRADVVRLRFSPRLEPILPTAAAATEPSAGSDVADMKAGDHQTAAASSPCRSRSDMVSVGWSYVKNKTYISAKSIKGASCSWRKAPPYIKNAGNWDSVPYDWGGADSPSEFNDYMKQDKAAGDINTDRDSGESCSRGVDCSGLVTRAWGYSAAQKKSTSTLPGVSQAITRSQAQPGDVILRNDNRVRHVAMIESIGSKVSTLESLTERYNRVMNLTSSWSRFDGWTVYRFQNVCGAQARPVVTSSLTLSSGSKARVGQSVHASFTITNRGSQATTLRRVLAGGRLNNNCCPDFPAANDVTLQPGQSYNYGAWRTMDAAGSYSYFVSYMKGDGSWVTNVDTENGARNSVSLTVEKTAPPSLTRHSPSSVHARWWDQTVYLYGDNLATTRYVYVQFPNGGTAYIYPPGQIVGRSKEKLTCKITFGATGTYYLWAYTAEGGWSNAHAVRVTWF